MKKYLWVQLFIFVILLLTLFFTLFSIFNIQTFSSNIQKHIILSADNTSNIILRSVYKAMLLNKKEEIRDVFSNISKNENVKLIRIYDKTGRIVFSINEKEIGKIVRKNTKSCYPCHKSEAPPVFLNIYEKARTFKIGNSKVIGVITPILNSPECFNSGCHFHSPRDKILGVLDVALSTDVMSDAVKNYKRKMFLWTGVIIFLSAFLSAYFIHRMVHSRIKELTYAADIIQKGNFNIEVPIYSEDEIGRLASSFNKMAKTIREMRDKLLDWSNTLEEKVKEKTEELERMYSHVIQVEKMAALGKIASAVAHQINNPLSGILVYTKLLKKKVEKISGCTTDCKEEMMKYLDIIEDTTRKSGEIVKNLLLFAKKKGGRFSEANLHDIIKRSIELVRHEMELKGINVETCFTLEDDKMIFDINEIQHSLVALLVNSIEAIGEEGLIRVSTREVEKDKILIEIEDTGHGIPSDKLPYIFEPFFTTKESGTGLGLSVVYGVIKRHGGKIEVESEENKGTKIKIFLPKKPEKPEDEED